MFANYNLNVPPTPKIGHGIAFNQIENNKGIHMS